MLADRERYRLYVSGKSVPEPNTGCWLWLGACNHKGYGTCSVNNHQEKAHRVSYEAFIGEIPKGTWVLHRCDTPACVNPEHLFLGDNAVNSADRTEKGRTRGGGANLTAEQVRWVRLQQGRDVQDVVRESGIHHHSIRLIWRGVNYKWVA